MYKINLPIEIKLSSAKHKNAYNYPENSCEDLTKYYQFQCISTIDNYNTPPVWFWYTTYQNRLLSRMIKKLAQLQLIYLVGR